MQILAAAIVGSPLNITSYYIAHNILKVLFSVEACAFPAWASLLETTNIRITIQADRLQRIPQDNKDI